MHEHLMQEHVYKSPINDVTDFAQTTNVFVIYFRFS